MKSESGSFRFYFSIRYPATSHASPLRRKARNPIHPRRFSILVPREGVRASGGAAVTVWSLNEMDNSDGSRREKLRIRAQPFQSPDGRRPRDCGQCRGSAMKKDILRNHTSVGCGGRGAGPRSLPGNAA